PSRRRLATVRLRFGRIPDGLSAPHRDVATFRVREPTMAISPPESFIALQRFGLGARPGDLKAIASDPRGALLAEINPGALLIDDSALPDTITAITDVRSIQMQRKAEKQNAQGAASASSPAPDASASRAPDMAMGDGTSAAVDGGDTMM